MGTLQLPQYQPQQIESDRSQRQLDVSGQVALGRSQSNLIGTALEGLDVLAGIAGKIRGQKIADEENAARLKYKQGTTTKMTELETNPISTPQEEYQGRGQGLLDETAPIMQDLPNHKAFVDFRKQLVEDINGGFKYDEARKRFQLWADGVFVSEQDAVLTWDIKKTKELLLDNFDEELIQAVELGDSGLALDLAKSGLEAGTISQKQYDDYLDDGFQKIAARGAIMYARKLGFEDGQKYLANRENLKWETHKGEQRQMSLKQQETLLTALREEEQIAESARQARIKRIDTEADEQMDTTAEQLRGDPGSLSRIFHDETNQFVQRMTRSTHDYWERYLKEALSTDPDKVVPTLEESSLLNSIYHNRQFDNPIVGDRISVLVEQGKLRATVAKKYVYDRMDDRKWLIRPGVSGPLDTMNRVWDQRIQQEKDPIKQGEQLREKTGAMNEFHRFLGEGPHTDVEIDSKAKQLANESITRAMRADWFNVETKTAVDERRARAQAGEVYTTDERATYHYNDNLILVDQYGIGKTRPGTAILSTRFSSSGMAEFLISNLNPEQPGKAFWYRLETSPETGTEQLMVEDKAFKRWAYSGVLSLKAEGAAQGKVDAAKAAAAAEQAMAAREAGLALEAAPARQAAAAAAKLPSIEQKIALDEFLRASRGGTTADDIAAAAKTIGVATDWLVQQVLARGISVSGLKGAATRGLLGGR